MGSNRWPSEAITSASEGRIKDQKVFVEGFGEVGSISGKRGLFVSEGINSRGSVTTTSESPRDGEEATTAGYFSHEFE